MAAWPNARILPCGKTLSIMRKNVQEMWGNISGLSFVVVGLSMQSNFRAMQPTSHSEINLSLHLHAEIGLSNASNIHLNTACIEIQ